MRVIYVHFDAAKNSVAVLPAAEVVFAGDEVAWVISATGKSITRVEVEFELKANSKRFSFGGSEEASFSQKIENGKALIQCIAPPVKKGTHARYKYTVRGFRGNKRTPLKLDPVIIIVPPEPIH